MDIPAQIQAYIASQPEQKRNEMAELHALMLKVMPTGRLWFLDGKDENGKLVSNPNIGYGFRTVNYANGKSGEFYQIGLSANTTGISIYILGLEDKMTWPKNSGKHLARQALQAIALNSRR